MFTLFIDHIPNIFLSMPINISYSAVGLLTSEDRTYNSGIKFALLTVNKLDKNQDTLLIKIHTHNVVKPIQI